MQRFFFFCAALLLLSGEVTLSLAADTSTSAPPKLEDDDFPALPEPTSPAPSTKTPSSDTNLAPKPPAPTAPSKPQITLPSITPKDAGTQKDTAAPVPPPLPEPTPPAAKEDKGTASTKEKTPTPAPAPAAPPSQAKEAAPVEPVAPLPPAPPVVVKSPQAKPKTYATTPADSGKKNESTAPAAAPAASKPAPVKLLPVQEDALKTADEDVDLEAEVTDDIVTTLDLDDEALEEIDIMLGVGERPLSDKEKKIAERQREEYQKKQEETAMLRQMMKNNYKNEQLSPLIYRASYDSANQHLPKALYPSDLKRAIYKAAAEGDLGAIRALLPKSGSVNSKDAAGNTLLLYATMYNQPYVVDFLLSKDASVNTSNKDLLTPLHIAAYNGRTDIVRTLHAAGGNLYARDRIGQTPVTYALNSNNSVLITYVLSKLSAGEAQNLLLDAASKGDSNTVMALLNRNVDVNGKDRQGNTPLMLATRANAMHSVGLLLQHGASVNAKNYQGKTALDMAYEQNNTMLMDQLSTAGGMPSVYKPAPNPVPVTPKTTASTTQKSSAPVSLKPASTSSKTSVKKQYDDAYN